MMSKRDSENKKDRKNVSRRDFLKYSGTIVLVMGSGCYFSGNSNSKTPNTPLTSRSGIPAADGYLLVDIEKCQGCVSCMLACSLVHEGVESQSLSRIQIIQNSFKAFPDDITIEQCRQCVEPACVEACPTGALRADAAFGNTRIVDRNKCIGCGECVEACPYTPSRSILASDEDFDGEDKARKCDLCANTPFHWDEAGGGPNGKQACVEICPVGAIRFTTEIPVQDGDEGYKVNLRGSSWQRLGYPRG
jgi:protein NrfC